MLFIFDFDGTIAESAPGVLRSCQYAMVKMGYPEPRYEDLGPFMGPPLNYSFHTMFGLSWEDAAKAVSFFRERYVAKGMRECCAYPGIPELLERVQKAGHTSAIASAKPEVFVREILADFGILEHFDVVIGASMDETETDKAANIRRVIRLAGFEDRMDEVVMIGDRLYDIEGAKEVGAASVGVLYGYGSREELEGAGSDRIAATVEELGEILLA